MSLVPTEAPMRGPGRPLGLRAEPALRLAMGYRDEERRGAPVKTDYFIAKHGPDGTHKNAADKFRRVYGEKPKAIDILLMPELSEALRVEHIAWGGAGDGEGGTMKARGRTNFATVGTLGGPDVLTVWRPDGSLDEVEISGVEDPAAKELGVQLHTTFRFYIPEVLGAASFCEITSKGAKTTDNLFAKLVELYGLFGSRVTFIVKPKLVLRPATGRPLVIDKDSGQPKRIKSTYYALDLYVPESFDEMFERLRERHSLLTGGQARAALYGGEATRELPAASVEEAGEPGVANGADARSDSAAAVDAASPADDVEEVEGEVVEDDEPSLGNGRSDDPAVEKAGQAKVPKGEAKGMALAEIFAEEDGRGWFEWALSREEGYWSKTFRTSLDTFAAARLPDLHRESEGRLV